MPWCVWGHTCPVGEHCVIGMGSTVTKAILPGVTVIGNPAKIYERKEK